MGCTDRTDPLSSQLQRHQHTRLKYTVPVYMYHILIESSSGGRMYLGNAADVIQSARKTGWEKGSRTSYKNYYYTFRFPLYCWVHRCTYSYWPHLAAIFFCYITYRFRITSFSNVKRARVGMNKSSSPREVHLFRPVFCTRNWLLIVPLKFSLYEFCVCVSV